MNLLSTDFDPTKRHRPDARPPLSAVPCAATELRPPTRSGTQSPTDDDDDDDHDQDAPGRLAGWWVVPVILAGGAGWAMVLF